MLFRSEWARMMVLLQAMQGLGKPGVGIWGTAMGAPRDNSVWFPAYGDPDGRIAHSKVARVRPENPVAQRLYRPIVPDAILNRMRRASEKSKEHALAEGIAIAREMLARVRGGVQGVQVSAPFGRVELALDVFR